MPSISGNYYGIRNRIIRHSVTARCLILLQLERLGLVSMHLCAPLLGRARKNSTNAAFSEQADVTKKATIPASVISRELRQVFLRHELTVKVPNK